MAYTRYRTDEPLALPKEVIEQVVKNHYEICAKIAQNPNREVTGNAKAIVTKSPLIPSWVE